MSDRGLLTIGIVLFVVAILAIIALVAPNMRRIFWILGLSIALLEFGGITTGIAVHAISHRALNTHALFALLVNAYMSWVIVEYLHKKIKETNPSLDQISN